MSRTPLLAQLDDPRVHRALVLTLLVLALLVRLLFARDWNHSQPPDSARLRGDEISYDALAREILAGEQMSWPGRVPVYPVFVALVHGVSGFSYAALTFVQALIGAMTVALTYALARWRFGNAAGLLALAGSAFSYVLIRHSVQVMSEPLYAPAVLLLAFALYRALERPTVARFAVAGAMLGLGNLIRPTLLLFPLFLAALVPLLRVPRGGRRWLQLTLAMLLALAPWQVLTTARYGVLLPLATSNAILWQGSPEYYHLLRTHGMSYLDVWEQVLYAPNDDAPDPGTIEGEPYWRARAVGSIRAEPITYVRYALEKTVTYWVGDPEADWGGSFIFDPRAFRRWGFSWPATAQLLLARAFPLVALIGVLVLWRYRRELSPVLAILLYATALHAATHAEARLSEPFQPLLIVIVSAALVRVAWPAHLRVRPLTPGADVAGAAGAGERLTI